MNRISNHTDSNVKLFFCDLAVPGSLNLDFIIIFRKKDISEIQTHITYSKCYSKTTTLTLSLCLLLFHFNPEEKAIMWYKLGAEGGSDAAKENLRLLLGR